MGLIWNKSEGTSCYVESWNKAFSSLARWQTRYIGLTFLSLETSIDAAVVWITPLMTKFCNAAHPIDIPRMNGSNALHINLLCVSLYINQIGPTAIFHLGFSNSTSEIRLEYLNNFNWQHSPIKALAKNWMETFSRSGLSCWAAELVLFNWY